MAIKFELNLVLVAIAIICMIISVAVAASSGTKNSNGSYNKAWITFFVFGIVDLFVLAFLLYPRRDAVVEKVANALKRKTN